MLSHSGKFKENLRTRHVNLSSDTILPPSNSESHRFFLDESKMDVDILLEESLSSDTILPPSNSESHRFFLDESEMDVDILFEESLMTNYILLFSDAMNISMIFRLDFNMSLALQALVMHDVNGTYALMAALVNEQNCFRVRIKWRYMLIFFEWACDFLPISMRRRYLTAMVFFFVIVSFLNC